MSNTGIGGSYREMLDDYRDVDIDELMKGLTEEELLALDAELERDVIQPNPSYSLRAPTPPPVASDSESSDDDAPAPPNKEKSQQMVGIPAPLYRKLIEEGKGVWIEHPTFGKVFQPDLNHVPAELLRPAPVDQVKRIERSREAEQISEPEWMEKQLRSIQINTSNAKDDVGEENNERLQRQMEKLQSVPRRKGEYERQFTNKVDRQLNQVKSALQQVDHDEIELFKKEHNEEDLDDDELVNSNSPEDILARVWENDPELKTVNLNNILNIPQELLEELMEALEENVYVTELTLVNTGILDKVAHALAKTLKRNRTLEKVNCESNFITGDGGLKIIKAIQKNTVLHELRIDNQRHIFGQNIEGEFVKYLRHNETLCRFGYQFGNAGHRMTCSNYMTRNTDKKRRERIALNRAMGKRPEPRKQIKVVSTSKKRKQHSAAARMQAPAAGATIPLPRLVTDRENDLQDNDITNLLDNMDEKEMARLEQWFMAKNGVSNGASGAPAPPSGPGAPPPPPPSGLERPTSGNPNTKSGRKALLSDLSSTPQLKKVVAPEQKLILPEAIGSEEGNRFAKKVAGDSESD